MFIDPHPFEALENPSDAFQQDVNAVLAIFKQCVIGYHPNKNIEYKNHNPRTYTQETTLKQPNMSQDQFREIICSTLNISDQSSVKEKVLSRLSTVEGFTYQQLAEKIVALKYEELREQDRESIDTVAKN